MVHVPLRRLVWALSKNKQPGQPRFPSPAVLAKTDLELESGMSEAALKDCETTVDSGPPDVRNTQ